jgi:hypothetical protein
MAAVRQVEGGTKGPPSFSFYPFLLKDGQANARIHRPLHVGVVLLVRES